MTSRINNNWKAFIFNTLTKNGQFRLEKSYRQKQTDIEVYRQLAGDTATTLNIGYLNGERLAFLRINNDRTPGLNIHETEAFDDDDFSPVETYGGAGLTFAKRNQDGILSQLSNGLEGKETVYYKNGKLSHSKLTLVYSSRLKNSASYLFQFETPSLWQKIKNLFNKQTSHYQTIEVDLKLVFGGLK